MVDGEITGVTARSNCREPRDPRDHLSHATLREDQAYFCKSSAVPVTPLHNKMTRPTMATTNRKRVRVRKVHIALVGGSLACAAFHDTPSFGKSMAICSYDHFKPGGLSRETRDDSNLVGALAGWRFRDPEERWLAWNLAGTPWQATVRGMFVVEGSRKMSNISSF